MTEEFDLSRLAVSDYRSKRPGLYVFIAATVALGLEMIYFAGIGVEHVSKWGLDSTRFLVDASIVSVLLFFVLLLGLSVPRFLPGARSILIDDEGVTLVYSPTRRDVLRWDNTKDRFYIQDFSAFPKLVQRGRAYFLYLSTWSRLGRDRRSLITSETMEAILRRAQENQASYRTWKGTSLWNGYSPQTHWFEGRRRPSK